MSLARLRAPVAVLIASLVVGVPAAYAVFNQTVTATTSFSAYTVPAPTGIGCTGLGLLSTSKIVWDAVTPPAGSTVDYRVTVPGGATTFVTTNSYSLPTVAVFGQYKVATRISPGAWTSADTTITTTSALGLYLCSTP